MRTALKPSATASVAPVYRKLWPADRERLATHLLRIDGVDRQMRFCGGISDQGVRDYCARIDWTRTTVLGCFVDRELRGAAELVFERVIAPGNAELALTVERPLQDQGVGSALLHQAQTIARNRYVTTVHLVCLPENRRMQHLARKFGASLTVEPDGVAGRLAQPWPTYLSYLEEVAAEGRALLRATIDLAAAPEQR